MRLFACAATAGLVLAATSPAAAQDAAQPVVGPWHGVLVVGATVLRVVVRVKDDGKGGYQGEMVSPDQSPRPIPLSDVKLAGGHFSFAIPVASISFDGKWDASHGAWNGQFTQQGAKLPLTLAKGELAPATAPTATPSTPASPAAKPSAPAGANKTVESVTVTAQAESAIKTDIDRRSYDITHDLQAQTGSIADALRNVPSVQVDVQGNVSLRGDANVTIMIDGKPSSLFSGPAKGQVLQSLPASSFERVEVMTNPSAAFRPDGSAGIINLIPKSARAIGTSGTARVNIGPDGRTSLGLNANSVSKTLTLSGDLVYAHDRQLATTEDHRQTPDPVDGGVLDSMQNTRSAGDVDVFVGRAAFDYDPDAKTRISGELRCTGIDAKLRDTSVFAGEAPGDLVEGYDRDGLTSLQRINLAATATWRRKFAGDGHDLVVSATQERNTDQRIRSDETTSTTPVLPSFAEDIHTDVAQDISHLKVDYTRPLAGDAKLKLGYELQVDLDDFDNSGVRGPTIATQVVDPTLVDHFRFDQAVNGAYVTYQRPFGDLTVLGGLRLEDTQIDINDVTSAFKTSRDEVNAYPTLHLAYKLSDAQQLTASFSERIQRPQPSDYNPFRVYIDPFNFRAGNPDLEPQLTYSYEAAYQYRAGTTFYLATLYFRDNNHGVTDVVQDLGGGVLLTTKENLSHSENAGLELVLSGQVLPKVTVNFSTNLGWTQIDATDLGFTGRQSAFTPSAQGVVNWQITPKDLVQVQGVLTGKRLTPQGYHQPTGLVNVGYRHKLNNDWSFFATSRDTLGSYNDVLVIDTPALKDRVTTHVNLQAVFLGATYSFGGGRRRDPGFDFGATPPAR